MLKYNAQHLKHSFLPLCLAVAVCGVLVNCTMAADPKGASNRNGATTEDESASINLGAGDEGAVETLSAKITVKAGSFKAKVNVYLKQSSTPSAAQSFSMLGKAQTIKVTDESGASVGDIALPLDVSFKDIDNAGKDLWVLIIEPDGKKGLVLKPKIYGGSLNFKIASTDFTAVPIVALSDIPSGIDFLVDESGVKTAVTVATPTTTPTATPTSAATSATTTATSTPTPSGPTLGFVSLPTTVSQNKIFSLSVEILDTSGTRMTTDNTTSVTLSVCSTAATDGSCPSATGTLSGTLTKTLTSGFVTFSDLHYSAAENIKFYITSSQSQKASAQVSSLSTDYFVNFDGSNDYVSTNLDIESFADLTFSVWVRPQIPSGSLGAIITNDNCGSDRGLLLTNGLKWYVNVGSSGVNTNVSLNANQWYHAVLVYSSTNTELFIDGVSAWTRGSASTGYAGSAALKIGRGDCNSGESYFKGAIDDVRIYSKALSSSEVTTLYNSGTRLTTNPFGSDRVAWWKFNEGTSTSVVDAVTGYTGTLQNGPTWQTGYCDDSDLGDCAVTTTQGSSYTLTLRPGPSGNDSYYIKDNPSTVPGGQTNLRTCNEFYSAYVNRAYMAFSLASIPVGATITSATLTLYYYTHENCCGQSYNMDLRNAKAFDESTLNYTTYTDTSVTPLPSPVTLTSVYLTYGDYKWYTFPTSTALVNYLTTAQSVGTVYFELKGNDTSWNAAGFHSSESTSPAMRPTLTITYQ